MVRRSGTSIVNLFFQLQLRPIPSLGLLGLLFDLGLLFGLGGFITLGLAGNSTIFLLGIPLGPGYPVGA